MVTDLGWLSNQGEMGASMTMDDQWRPTRIQSADVMSCRTYE